jgi:hypothetical protein
MKIVVYGAERRVGALVNDPVVAKDRRGVEQDCRE